MSTQNQRGTCYLLRHQHSAKFCHKCTYLQNVSITSQQPNVILISFYFFLFLILKLLSLKWYFVSSNIIQSHHLQSVTNRISQKVEQEIGKRISLGGPPFIFQFSSIHFAQSLSNFFNASKK